MAGCRCCLLTGWVEQTDSREIPFVVHRARPLTKFPVWKRLLSWAIFTLQAVLHIARNRRIPILITTNPPWPMLVMPLMKRLFGVRYLLQVYDIYPDVLVLGGSGEFRPKSSRPTPLRPTRSAPARAVQALNATFAIIGSSKALNCQDSLRTAVVFYNRMVFEGVQETGSS